MSDYPLTSTWAEVDAAAQAVKNGLPKANLSGAVQASLEKADGAVQVGQQRAATDWDTEEAGIDENGKIVTRPSMSDEAKYSLLNLLSDVAYATQNGAALLADLEDKLFPTRHLSSITAAYDQDRPILDTNSLDLVKLDLVVTANYSDGTTETLADDAYELSGTLTAGTSTITVSYGGKTDEISVTVKHNYASELSNFQLTGNSDTTYSDGVISLKCSTSTQYNNYSQWAADLKGTTLWDDVNGKTLKVRIYSKGVNFGEYSDTNKIIIGVFAFKDATITSTSADKRKGKTLYSYAPTEQYGWTEGTVECDLSQFTTGTLTPTSASTFGVQITSRSYATVQIAAVEVYEV